MGGYQTRRSAFDGSSISRILLQSVKMHQMAARPVHEIAQHLFHNCIDRLSLPILAHRPEQPVKCRTNPDSLYISSKQTQSAPRGQRIRRYADTRDFVRFPLALSRFSPHLSLHPLGYGLLLISVTISISLTTT